MVQNNQVCKSVNVFFLLMGEELENVAFIPELS